DNISGGWGISYIDSVRIVAKSEWDSVTVGDRAVLISGSDQFALSFLEQTGPICEAMSGDFSSIWSSMGSHYTSLSAVSKDNFTDNDTLYVEIVAAQDRYIFIVNKYTSLDKFVVDSDNQQYQGVSDIIGYDFGDNSNIIIIVVIGLMITSAGAFFIFSRRRKETA
ncbi:MAG: LPXTG cell wall anchor domain-containing protein, partial [Bacilli bacterium]